jgi:GTPase SAR1 family protein
MKDKEFKIAIVGNNNSGKFSLTKRMATGKFLKKNIKNLNISQQEKFEHVYLDEKIKLNFICSNKKNAKIYSNCNAIIITIDLTSIESFRSIPSWIENIKTSTNIDFIILVGTKQDSQDSIIIDNKKIINLCKNYENNNIKYIETSSKTGHNISELIELLINSIYLHKTDKITKDINKEYCTFDNISETIELLPQKKKSKFMKFIHNIFPCFE